MLLKGRDNVSYSRWATKEEVAKKLKAVNVDTGAEKSGVQVMFDDKFLYIDDRESHNLVIGSTGSGKTQVAILPILRLAMEAKESIVLNDPKGEICKKTSYALKNKGYEVKVLDFNDAKFGDNWNPLTIPYELYNSDNKDRAMKMLDDLGYYLFFDPKETSDPFWTNTTIDYFTGLVLYLFENAKKEEVNLNSVFNLSSDINRGDVSEFIYGIDKTSNIYVNLSGTLTAHQDTRAGILSTFNQKMKKYVSRVNLSNMLSYSDIDLKEISNKPYALFIIGGDSTYNCNLIPLLVSQIIECVSIFGNQEKCLNILLDEFDSMLPIKNFANVINYCRGIRVKITATIRSYVHLNNMYSKDEAEILKMCFGNLIYLLTDDIYTLEEISRYCGNRLENGNVVPLISVEELKTLEVFEAVMIMPRMMPFKTKLLPDYEIYWGYDNKDSDIPVRKEKVLSLYELK